ncbi:MAG: acyl-CoA thioester hydrolase [Saprospiraceae bacterium]|jgi:acyl-CoA thioester hydrolase
MDIKTSLESAYPEIKRAGVVEEYLIHWGDMDAAQHVNNLIYLRWCESARISYFKAIGIDTSFTDNVGPILGWMDAKYIRPLTFPDQVIVTTSTIEIKSDRLVLEGRVYSQTVGKLAFISKQEIIPYDYKSLCKAETPTNWLINIKNLQPSSEF